MDKNEISRTDWLAIDRTHLANERTFLAYFRTALVLLSSGLAILKIDILSNLKMLGFFFTGVSLIVFTMGIVRFFVVKKRINKYYK